MANRKGISVLYSIKHFKFHSVCNHAIWGFGRMNTVQVAMLFIAGGFILSIMGVNQTLKCSNVVSIVRKKVLIALFTLAIIVIGLLTIVLWKLSM